MELVLKLVGWGKSYFYNGWNQFDCLVVLSSVTGAICHVLINGQINNCIN